MPAIYCLIPQYVYCTVYRANNIVKELWPYFLPLQVTYTDFVTAAKLLGKELKEKGCDYIIALTHMRTPNDIR